MFEKTNYIGRFAPSPTGPLHLGSLYTALASFLDAKYHQGQWLLRIDDLDIPRNITGVAAQILSTLETFGLHWDATVSYQSDSLSIYENALTKLASSQMIYPCICSRKTLATEGDCHCLEKKIDLNAPHAYRVKADQRLIEFNDQLQGTIISNMVEQDDFILKRKDQIVAYQFAVVLDDAFQGVNHVVRGYDLLALTPKQIYLQKLLGLATPAYMHVPIIMDAQGFKLSKQTLAAAVSLKEPQRIIFQLLQLLRQSPPQALKNSTLSELLAWAIKHWSPEHLKNCHSINQFAEPS